MKKQQAKKTGSGGQRQTNIASFFGKPLKPEEPEKKKPEEIKSSTVKVDDEERDDGDQGPKSKRRRVRNTVTSDDDETPDVDEIHVLAPSCLSSEKENSSGGEENVETKRERKTKPLLVSAEESSPVKDEKHVTEFPSKGSTNPKRPNSKAKKEMTNKSDFFTAKKNVDSAVPKSKASEHDDAKVSDPNSTNIESAKDNEKGQEKDPIEEEIEEEVEEEAELVAEKVAAKKLARTSDWKAGVGDDIEWKKGDNVPYAALCKTFAQIEATTKRLQILEYITTFFRSVIELDPGNLLESLYLCINRLGPTYEGLELGIGESLLMKAVASATGRSVAKVKADVDELGDLGQVAQASRNTQPTMFRPKPLTVQSVFKTLKEIASITGGSSMNRKIDKIKFLLVSCRGNEAKYLIRSLEGKLRIGLAEQTVIVGIAHAAVLSREGKSLKSDKLENRLAAAAATLKSVYSELPCYDSIIPVLLDKGIDALTTDCKLTPGIPLKPMLAHPTKSLTEVLDRFEGVPFTCEYKYDGERAQVHLLEDGKFMIYSRNSENMSAKYPDIMETMPKVTNEGITTYVLDCEAVAWDAAKNCILPFQVLSTRKRKDVATEDITVKVCVFAFDLLYINGMSLLQESLSVRRELLKANFKAVEGQFGFAKSMISSKVEDIQIFLDESVANNCEGLMVKVYEGREASYEPSKRSRNWLKVKKDYIAGVGDSLDLVVIGAYIGRGKRTGVYGGYLLACYDPDQEEYQCICKIGTGFSEENLRDHHQLLKSKVIESPKSYYRYGEGTKPDVWFEPSQVWEIQCADLSISPVYQAAVGKVDANKGISLRFPRFIRVRDDKNPENATTSEQVAEFYNKQAVVQNNSAGKPVKGGGVDDDFEY